MMNLALLLNKGLDFAPRRQAWIEAAGYVLIGLGIILGLAAYSFSPSDYVNNRLNFRAISNAAGPVGAYLARELLGRFGIVGLLWPIALVTWGLMVVFGFLVFPTAKRILGFIGMNLVLATFAEIQLHHMGLSEPQFGYGGTLGRALSIPVQFYMGYAGSLVMCLVAAGVVLALTGNIAASNTAGHILTSKHKTSRGLRRFIQVVLEFKRREDARVAALRLRQEELANPWAALLREPTRDGKTRKTAASDTIDVESKPAGAKKEKLPEAVAAAAAPADETLDFYFHGPLNELPGASLFKRSAPAPQHPKDFHRKMAERLTAQLAEFKVEGQVTDVFEGPVVTTFEFEPSPGTKVSKVTNLSEDLARLLEARSLRILAPIPGKKVLGFEVPNDEARMIGFADLIAGQEFRSPKYALPIAMGMDTNGQPKIADLAAMPHLLIAGSTGSGKSVFMNSLIASLLARHQAKDLRLIMIDPKMVEMAAYNDIPHLACPVITDPEGDARAKLRALVKEMDQRYELMQQLGAKNITGFNQTIKTGKKTSFPKFEGKWQTLPYIVLIVDELADMMMVLGKDAETPITRLAQKARAAGIHLVIATQRPSADVVTGLIKANFPTRVAFRVLSGIDSRTILDASGAEDLLGRGDMLFLSDKGLERLHGAYLSEEEVAKMVKSCKKKK